MPSVAGIISVVQCAGHGRRCAMTEIWKPIPGWPYAVSSEGRVRRSTTRAKGGAKAGHILKQQLSPNGHFMVTLQHNMERRNVTVHNLVTEAFHGPPGPYLTDGGKVVNQEVCHLNGVKVDNRAVNLAWGTRSESLLAAVRLGKVPRGEQVWNAKLTDDAVREIRRSSRSCEELARHYGVSPSTVRDARHHRKWKHVDNVDYVRRRTRPTGA